MRGTIGFFELSIDVQVRFGSLLDSVYLWAFFTKHILY